MNTVRTHRFPSLRRRRFWGSRSGKGLVWLAFALPALLGLVGLTLDGGRLYLTRQRAVNVCLGAALATVGLTIPAVLTIGLITNRNVHLGLDPVETALLMLTLFVSALTFGGARTNVLQGIVHLLLFVVYVALIFSP